LASSFINANGRQQFNPANIAIPIIWEYGLLYNAPQLAPPAAMSPPDQGSRHPYQTRLNQSSISTAHKLELNKCGPIKWAENLLPARVTDFGATTKPLLQNIAGHSLANHSLAMIKLRPASRA
jgi:hypothetical protein